MADDRMTSGATGGDQDQRGVVPAGQCDQLHKILQKY